MRCVLFITIAVCMLFAANASNLRRSSTSMAKMDQFMAIYGEQLKNAPAYRKDPVEYLAKFVANTKQLLKKSK